MFFDKCSVDGAASAATVNQSRGGEASTISWHLDLYVGCQGFITSA